MIIENFWEYLLCAILAWIMVEEFVWKSMPEPARQPVKKDG